jgi:hypothetical protein
LLFLSLLYKMSNNSEWSISGKSKGFSLQFLETLGSVDTAYQAVEMGNLNFC